MAKIMSAGTFALRCAAYLALAGLALQLVLSFAHIHRHDFAFSSSAPLHLASLGHARQQEWAARQLPSGLADDDEHCPICFSSFLLSNSSIPGSPLNSLSPEFGNVDRSVKAASNIVLQPRRAAFLSRAPPAA